MYLAGIEKLSPYAWRFRYPGAPYSPEETEADAAREAAARLFQALASRLTLQFAG